MPRAKKTTQGDGKPAPRKRVRKKVGVKPGKVSWIHGTKLTFFASRADDWKAASEQGNDEAAAFYGKITNLYLLKYGHNLKDEEDLADDIDDPTDPDARIPGSENLSKEEADEWSKNTIKLRKKIAAWYCRTYRRVDEREKQKFAEVLLGGLENTGPGCPRKAQPIHYYSRHYYEEKVKARFDAVWAIEVQRAKDLEEDEPWDIKIRNEVTKQVFSEESEEFKTQLALAVEAEHVAAVRAWELTRADAPARSAEEINAALKNAAFYLDPLAEAIRDKFGMNCSILLCGPMGDRGGAIEVRSVHAGRTRGVGARKWYEIDPMGYEAAEKLMIKFSERCFTEEECISRTYYIRATHHREIIPEQSLTSQAIPGAPGFRSPRNPRRRVIKAMQLI
ncbi:hypothetical protein C8F04DRAFT_1250794 [Mycena alexandri]|uniref:Uncharacterized protein n=1 Tax=Mycena alexandri TaxID=1745969 RepID=A0AAD6XDC4_9AGAR|nr:hypothetical protein C8F04DRAFT_1250794 [Mycena alexandri]